MLGELQVVEKKINGCNPAVPGNDEISTSVSWRVTRAARYPSDTAAVAQFFGRRIEDKPPRALKHHRNRSNLSVRLRVSESLLAASQVAQLGCRLRQKKAEEGFSLEATGL